MTFLELCQAVRREAGIAGTGPTTVVGQDGIYEKVVKWVVRAWHEIQNKRDHWSFLYNTKQLSLIIGTRAYTSAAMGITGGVRAWIEDSFKIYDPAIGVSDQNWLPFKPYEDWVQSYDIGTQTNNRPVCFTESPTGEILFGPTPDKAYVVDLAYFRDAVTLTADGDVPAITSELHDVIMYKALMFYAAHDEAPDVRADAKINFDDFYIRLENKYLPRMEVGSTAIGD